MLKLYAYFRLLRPLNLLQGAIALLVTATLMDSFPAWKVILCAVLIVWCYTGAGNALNDYCDADIDKINRPKRPIPQGLVARAGALRLSIVLFLIGSVTAFPFLTKELAVIIGLALFFLIAYSPVFKKRALWGNVIVSAILGMTFLFAAILYGDLTRGIAPFCLAFGFNLIREMVKDVQDVSGDHACGAQTLPLKYGIVFTRRIIIFCTLLLMVGALVPYGLGIYGKYYLLTLIFGVEIPLGFFIYSLQKDSSAANCARLAALLKGDIFMGLLAIFLGKF
jgi:geranylgeranylglycerol-phosphate geranylgeranyltransferase